jgi:hypothetical protein
MCLNLRLDVISLGWSGTVVGTAMSGFSGPGTGLPFPIGGLT